MLHNPETTLQTCWSIIDRFLNIKKIPIIPPILANTKLIPDFQKKADLFNNGFAPQYTPAKKTTRLPNFKYKIKLIKD